MQYLHSDIDTITRIEILRELRLGTVDVLVGINLLREGLDLPEVALVAILDADKEGFLRSASSLIQTMGRAARNVDGVVVLYADTVTDSMREAVSVTQRRREVQIAYNLEHGIDPQTIRKSVTDILERLRGTSGGVAKAGRSRAEVRRNAAVRGNRRPRTPGRGRRVHAGRRHGAHDPARGRNEGGRRRAALRRGRACCATRSPSCVPPSRPDPQPDHAGPPPGAGARPQESCHALAPDDARGVQQPGRHRLRRPVNELYVSFRNGTVYRYFQVPSSVHRALLSAPSIGRYFNETVRDRYPSQRLRGEEAH